MDGAQIALLTLSFIIGTAVLYVFGEFGKKVGGAIGYTIAIFIIGCVGYLLVWVIHIAMTRLLGVVW